MTLVRYGLDIVVIALILSISGCDRASSSELASLNPAYKRLSKDLNTILLFEPSVVELPDLTINTNHTFSVLARNIGPRQIIVKSLSAGCACTDLAISKTVIQPGDCGRITGVFKAGPEPTESTRLMVIKTETGESFEVPVKARIVRSLLWEPNALVLRPDILHGRAAEGEIRISSRLSDAVTINAAACNDPDVVVDIQEPHVTKRTNGIVRVRASANVLRRGTILVDCMTTHASENMLQIPIHLAPVYYLEAAPSTIHLGVLTPEQLDKRVIKASVRGPLIKHLCFQRVEYPSSVVATIETRTEDEIACVLKPVVDHSGAALSGTVKFVFERNAESTVISIPVWGIIDTRKAHSLNRRQSL